VSGDGDEDPGAGGSTGSMPGSGGVKAGRGGGSGGSVPSGSGGTAGQGAGGAAVGAGGGSAGPDGSRPASAGGSTTPGAGGGGGSGGGTPVAGGSDASVPPGATPDARVSNAPLGALPVIYLDVPGRTPDSLPSPNDQKVTGMIKVIEDHDGTHMGLAMRPVAFQTRIAIGKRGSSSAGFPQKSFSVEFQDATGMEKGFPVLGMPSNGDWALVACWTDKPCLRNALAYAIGNRLGRWAPRLVFVEVFFNNSYQGLYQFVEPPRADKQRVAIPKPAADMTGGDAFTGGYIVRREQGGKGTTNEGGKSYPRDWLSATKAPGTYPHQMVYTLHYPKETVITAAQKTYIQGHIAAFENAMKGADWPMTYRSWIETTSWLDFMIMNELGNNVDGYWKSFYITKQPDVAATRGKLLATPLWDFNLGFGNANYRDGWRTDKLNFAGLVGFGGECAGGGAPKDAPVCDGLCCQSNSAMNTCKTKCWNMPIVPFYWERLQGDTPFRNDLKCRWKELRKAGGPLDMAVVDGWIAAWKAQIQRYAMARHFARWPDLRKYQWPNPYMVDPSTAPEAGATLQQFFDKEVKWFRDWVDKRAKYLDNALPGTCP
jgi:hypothetical protein